MSQHTPGPWERRGHRIIAAPSRERVVTPMATICETYSWMGIEEADANEALISAAPQMLEALEAQQLVDEHVASCEECVNGMFPEICEAGAPIADKARLLRWAAIRKARGVA